MADLTAGTRTRSASGATAADPFELGRRHRSPLCVPPACPANSMRDTGLKIGRRKASGFRLVRCHTRLDLSPTLAVMVPNEARLARGLLRRAVQARGMHGIRLKPQESQVALHLATTGVLECEEKALGTAAEPRWIPWRAVLAP